MGWHRVLQAVGQQEWYCGLVQFVAGSRTTDSVIVV